MTEKSSTTMSRTTRAASAGKPTRDGTPETKVAASSQPATSTSAGSGTEDRRPVNVYAAISLTAGIASLCGLVFPASIVAIVLGHVGLSSAKRGNERGRGSALFGLVVGYIALVGGFIVLIVLLSLGVLFTQQVPNMIDGFTSGITDSVTGSVQDQLGAGGLIEDPATGFLVDPNTGQVFDPITMQEIDPATGQPIG